MTRKLQVALPLAAMLVVFSGDVKGRNGAWEAPIFTWWVQPVSADENLKPAAANWDARDRYKAHVIRLTALCGDEGGSRRCRYL